ncbi:MAG TPA: hypothetical protein VFJ29_06300, partial [Candidatus Kapabacteria bacterium]|nr:hypothetical protein [Candidatus Kapabacteria bacterium]
IIWDVQRMSNPTVQDVFKALVNTADTAEREQPTSEKSIEAPEHDIPHRSLRISFYSDAIIALD